MALVFLRDLRYVCISADSEVKPAHLQCAVRDYVYQQREVNYEETGTPDEMPELSPGPPIEHQSSAVHQILSLGSWIPLTGIANIDRIFQMEKMRVSSHPPAVGWTFGVGSL